MPAPLEIAISKLDNDDQPPTLTFAAFARANRGLSPAMQLEAFLRLPPELQGHAWSSLQAELDGNDDLANAAA